MTEKMKENGLASIIKYEGENDIFIWKHPIEDFNYGSQLIVLSHSINRLMTNRTFCFLTF